MRWADRPSREAKPTDRHGREIRPGDLVAGGAWSTRKRIYEMVRKDIREAERNVKGRRWRETINGTVGSGRHPPMKLWIVDAEGWDTEYTVVRAETAEDAVRLGGGSGSAEELVTDGEEMVLWKYERNAPDSRRGE